MNIGLLTASRYQRYGFFWEAFVAGLGLKYHTPQWDVAEALAYGAQLLEDERPSVQLLAAQAIELAPKVDVLLVPDFNPHLANNAGDAHDPWAVDAAAMLSRRLTLPQTIAVPTNLNETTTAGLAVRLGQTWVQNPQLVRRALDRNQHLLKEARYLEPVWQVAGLETVGVVADPILLESSVWQLQKKNVTASGLHLLGLNELPQSRLLELGRALVKREPRLSSSRLQTELETIGGFAAFLAKGQVQSLLFLSEPNAARQARLLGILGDLSDKPARQLVIETSPKT